MQQALTQADYASSVVAVPPIALKADYSVNAGANEAIIKHIETGGVDILLYGGNANLYHFGLEDYRTAMEVIKAAAAPTTHLITSIGPDFGKAMAQAPIARDLDFRNVMVLPTNFPADPAGVANGVRKLADAFGSGLILYLKRENSVDPGELVKLIAEKAVSFVKYAVEKTDASNDPYLDAVISAIGTDHLASGMGETPIYDHLGQRKLTTYTSGAVCIAPVAASELLTLYKTGRAAEALERSQPFLEFEKVRIDLGGLQVLHDGLRLSGIADTGPLMPMVSNLPADRLQPVKTAVDALKTAEKQATARASEPSKRSAGL